VGTGNRVSVNGARAVGRATGPGSSSGDGGRATDQTEPGWHRRRETGVGAERLRAGQPAAGPKRASPAEPQGTTGDV
jgi:hypothetical protein